MAQAFFLDTNIFVYAQDRDNSPKQKIANKLIREALNNSQGVISSQVVQEFCNVAVSKFSQSMKTSDLKEYLRVTLSRLWQHVPSLDFYYRAVELFERDSLSFYDALIVQAAIDLGCDRLYSEDLQSGRKFGNLTIVNPFSQS
ncbi:MAG TPA: PIN domain-containing protein [Candidatus Saccharimonadales bacterium]|nr:PIN domain-containing protein [Candidatus Saccharimonadales bacterium]